MLTSRHVLVLLSGGIDSTACVEYFASRQFHVEALFINYGQHCAVQELAAAKSVASYYGIPFRVLDVGTKMSSATYIRARNMFLLSLALLIFGPDSGLISIGIHYGTQYPDCSQNFLEASQRLFDLYESGRVQISAPFLNWTKMDIVEFARANNVPLHLTHTSNPGDIGTSALAQN